MVEYNSFKLKADKVNYKTGREPSKYRVYNPVNYKTSIRGYWTDDIGRVYKDYLKIDRYNQWQGVKTHCIRLCKDKVQLCIFVKNTYKAYIVNPNGIITTIFKIKKVIPLYSKADIRHAIRQYKSGITIYKTIKGYYAEVYN